MNYRHMSKQANLFKNPKTEIRGGITTQNNKDGLKLDQFQRNINCDPCLPGHPCLDTNTKTSQGVDFTQGSPMKGLWLLISNQPIVFENESGEEVGGLNYVIDTQDGNNFPGLLFSGLQAQGK